MTTRWTSPTSRPPGSYTYERTIEVDDGEAMSELDPALPAEATNPALCGVFEVAQMTMPEDGVATGGGSTAGTEQTAVLAAGALALALGGGGLVLTQRRADRRR